MNTDCQSVSHFRACAYLDRITVCICIRCTCFETFLDFLSMPLPRCAPMPSCHRGYVCQQPLPTSQYTYPDDRLTDRLSGTCQGCAYPRRTSCLCACDVVLCRKRRCAINTQYQSDARSHVAIGGFAQTPNSKQYLILYEQGDDSCSENDRPGLSA